METKEYPDIKRFKHPNPKSSRWYGILSDKIFNGEEGFGFVFYKNSENCYWPIKTSLYELIQDGWRQING